jgi:hypothetical protein
VVGWAAVVDGAARFGAGINDAWDEYKDRPEEVGHNNVIKNGFTTVSPKYGGAAYELTSMAVQLGNGYYGAKYLASQMGTLSWKPVYAEAQSGPRAPTAPKGGFSSPPKGFSSPSQAYSSPKPLRVLEGQSVPTGPNIVYRALNAKDAARIAQGLGLEPKNAQGTWTLREHLVHGSSRESWVNDPFIATSESPAVASGFNTSGSNLGVVAIDLSKVTAPVHRGFLLFPRMPGAAGLPYYYSVWQQEVTIGGSIPYQAIVGYVR